MGAREAKVVCEKGKGRGGVELLGEEVGPGEGWRGPGAADRLTVAANAREEVCVCA